MSEDKSNDVSEDSFLCVKNWLAENGCPDAANGVSDEAAWQSLLMDVIDAKDMSFSEINRKRKRLTFQAFQESSIIARTVALESLVGPNVHAMYRLFKRSHAIADLHRLPAVAIDERTKCSEQYFA